MLGGAADGSGRCNDATPLSFTGFLAHNAFSRKFICAQSLERVQQNR
jgi:hypothetical protein